MFIYASVYMSMYTYVYVITESSQGDVFSINFCQHKLKQIIFWHSCAFLWCEWTNVKYIEAIHHYFTYVNVFTLMHLSVLEFALIYLTLVCSHRRKAQECQKIICFNLC